MDQNRDETGRRPLRRDAEQNRRLIIQAAAAVFATRGQQVDVREIARCAGVGMGTLYRHFPTKEVLIETVMHQSFQDWAREATEAKDRESDSWLALKRFIHDSVARQADHRALLEALAGSLDADSGIAACTAPVRPILQAMVDGAQRSGELRHDVAVDDILALLIALGRITELQPDLLPVQWEKYVDIVIDGLRARPEG